MEVDLAEVAWAAGFLDGEGHFGIRRGLWVPVVEASQVGDRRPLDRLNALLGGGSVREKRRAHLSRPLYRWTLSGAEAILRSPLPFVIAHMSVKREQGETLIAAAAFVPARGTTRLHPLNKSMREALRLRIIGQREVFDHA